MTVTGAASLLVGLTALIAFRPSPFESFAEEYLGSQVATAKEPLLTGTSEDQVLRSLIRTNVNLSSHAPQIVRTCLLDADRNVLREHTRFGNPQRSRPVPEDLGRPKPFLLQGNRCYYLQSLERWGIANHQGKALYVEANAQGLADRKWDYVYTSSVVILISLLTSWLLSSRMEHIISRPIELLAQTTQRISADRDYTVRLAQRRNDEIGDLIGGFNEMLGQIEERDNALLQHREQLEHRVRERTRQLDAEIEVRKTAQKGLEQQLSRIRLLNRITQRIVERQDLRSILGEVLSQLTDHLPADFGCVLLHEASADTLRLASCREAVVDTTQLRASVGGWSIPCASSRFANPEVTWLHHTAGAGDGADPVFDKALELGLNQLVATKLPLETGFLGVLVLGRRGALGFGDDEIQFLQDLCRHVAVAGHQAHLHADLKQAYEELSQTQKAVMQHERLRALGQMASGVAHDINNALSPIAGFAELLLLNERGLSDNARKHLQYIKTASDDIAHIVSRLREFYRSRQEQQPLVPVDLNRLVPEVIELTRPRWRDVSQSRGVNVEVLSDRCPEPASILGIEPEIREALTNLIFNSLDAMPHGGTITLRTRTTRNQPTLDDAATPTHAVLEVVDTGTGMDEETRKRCFEPFFSTKGQRGTGLGLAMVYGTIQRHEGSLEVDSEPGQGTTMRLVFRLQKDQATPTGLAAPEPSLPSLRVLFVDDEPLLRELIRELLETEGHRVVTADGGPEGLATFRRMLQERQPPDVVITDLGMPRLDGRELSRLIKQESPSTPIIMMTGWGKMVRGEDEVRAPVDALVGKPPKLAELQQALRSVCPPAAR